MLSKVNHCSRKSFAKWAGNCLDVGVLHGPSVSSRGLLKRKIDVLTAFDDGAERIDDESLLLRATELGRVLVTHDKGFLGRAAQWQASNREFAGIVFVAQSPIDIGKTVEYLELLSHVMTAGEIRNRVEYIPRG